MEFTRGDTQILKFQRKDADGNVIMTAPDKMYFTAKKFYYSKETAIQKKIDDFTIDQDGYWSVTIQPEDTENLDYGEYYFDIEVVTSDYTKTIYKDTINLTAEVTSKKDQC